MKVLERYCSSLQSEHEKLGQRIALASRLRGLLDNADYDTHEKLNKLITGIAINGFAITINCVSESDSSTIKTLLLGLKCLKSGGLINYLTWQESPELNEVTIANIEIVVK